MRTAFAAGLVTLAIALVPSLGSAQEYRDHGGWDRDHIGDRDIHRFHEHDFDRWRDGHWFEGAHEGRHGWWWIVDGLWYFYPRPIYPFPDPYLPPVVATPRPPQPSYYFCDRPRGYYPYVAECLVPWRLVPGG